MLLPWSLERKGPQERGERGSEAVGGAGFSLGGSEGSRARQGPRLAVGVQLRMCALPALPTLLI